MNMGEWYRHAQNVGVQSLGRSTGIPTGCGIFLALLLGAATQSAASPFENVVVTGANSKAVNNFVQSAATPTQIIGKIARWGLPICPCALGLPDDAVTHVVQQVSRYYPAVFYFLGYDPFPPARTLPEQIAVHRRRLGWSVKMAAAKIGGNEGAFERWESGEGRTHKSERAVRRFLEMEN